MWDKSGSIEYIAPGRGRVWSRFELSDKDLEQIRHMTEAGDKHLHLFNIDIKDDEGMVVARVRKSHLYPAQSGNAADGTAGNGRVSMSVAPPWPYPRVLAHRGGGTLAPENTIAAIKVGLEHGFRAVEFDAMLAADDVPVLMHDPTLERTGSRQRRDR